MGGSKRAKKGCKTIFVRAPNSPNHLFWAQARRLLVTGSLIFGTDSLIFCTPR